MNVVTALFGWLVRLVLVAAALVLIVGLVAVALLALVASLLWALVTGRHRSAWRLATHPDVRGA
ncbi:MAG: hypothetical protein ACO3QW_09805, partial [Burkholderiaceae bacterium]